MAKIRDSGMPPVEQWETFFSPECILDVLACTKITGDAVEFGCGYGTFTIAAAHRTVGTLFTMDIDPAMIATTFERATTAGLDNIVAEQRDFAVAGSGLPDQSMSYAMVFNVLHLENPVELLREACRVLRPDATLAVIHWRRDIETPRGPPLTVRPRPADCKLWAEIAGLQWEASPELPNSPWHWGMTFRRPTNG